MFKKILIVLFLFSTFFVDSTFAKYNPKHNVKSDTVKQTIIKQHVDSGKPINYDAVRKKLGEPNMSNSMIDNNVRDGLEGDITRAVLATYDEKVDEGIRANGENTDTGKKATANEISSAKKRKETCKFDPDKDEDIRDSLEKCVGSSALVQVKDAYVTKGLKDVLNGWIKKIAGFLALGAIFAIAFGSLKLTLSMGEDDKIKKAKDIIKWGIIGFVAVISAGFLIAVVVNLIYSLAG